MKNTIITFLLLVAFQQIHTQHFIIPEPVKYIGTEEIFILNNKINIINRTDDEQVSQTVDQFIKVLMRAGIEASHQKVKKASAKSKAIFVILNKKNNPEIGNEGYKLKVEENSIRLTANTAAGIFNAFQTLRQLLPLEFEAGNSLQSTPINIMGCKIVDYPRFEWRGIMLDVSRHFFSVKDVKAYIDKMAQYKFNVLHWHLTDDEGWRVEIKSLPKLTEIGAWRVERHGRFGDTRPYPLPGEKASYGGFYTHEQIKEIVSYASDRNITIVPEIDFPGHSMAALAAYPELSTKKEEKFVNPGSKFAEWYDDGKFEMLIENTLNPADEKVYEFADKVFTEIAELFPGEYIHMGGDECYHGFWDADPSVQKFMKKNDIEDSHELQSYFVGRIQEIINSKGKKMIGWDEILEGGLAKGAAVMSWRGMDGGIEAAKMGHNVVMTPTTHTYLDYTQGDHSQENSIYSNLSLEKTYSFEPVPDDIDPKFVLGGQGNLWTEVIPSLSYAYHMTYPRALALSETFWSPKEKKDWTSFIDRTEMHFLRFDAASTNISKAILDPIVNVYMLGDKLMCELKNSVPNTIIYYTIDNTYPVQFGIKYSDPFEIPSGDLSLRTQTFRNGNSISRQLLIPRKDLVKRLSN